VRIPLAEEENLPELTEPAQSHTEPPKVETR